MPQPDEIRNVRLTVHKNAYGRPDYARLTIPVPWIRALNITDTTTVKAEFYKDDGIIVVRLKQR